MMQPEDLEHGTASNPGNFERGESSPVRVVTPLAAGGKPIVASNSTPWAIICIWLFNLYARRTGRYKKWQRPQNISVVLIGPLKQLNKPDGCSFDM
jgi:hypothetical protein